MKTDVEKKELPDKYSVDLPVIQGQKKDAGSQTITHVEIEVSYCKDRINMFQGVSRARGIYCSVGPVQIKKYALKDGGGESRGYGIMSAPTFLLEETKALNRRKVGDWWTKVKADLIGKAGKPWQTLTEILSKHNLSLKEEITKL